MLSRGRGSCSCRGSRCLRIVRRSMLQYAEGAGWWLAGTQPVQRQGPQRLAEALVEEGEMADFGLLAGRGSQAQVMTLAAGVVIQQAVPRRALGERITPRAPP